MLPIVHLLHLLRVTGDWKKRRMFVDEWLKKRINRRVLLISMLIGFVESSSG